MRRRYQHDNRLVAAVGLPNLLLGLGASCDHDTSLHFGPGVCFDFNE